MSYVVTHDQISFRDPEDGKNIAREHFHFLYASRGEPLPAGVSEREIKQLLANDAIAEEGSEAAKHAKAGLPHVSSLRHSPTALPLQSENERTQVMKATLAGVPGPAGPDSSRQELSRLPGEHIATMARVLGISVDDNSKKQDLIEQIIGKGDDATSAADIEEQRQGRDERQVAARDSGREAGLLGTNVRSDGTDREGGRVTLREPAASADDGWPKSAELDDFAAREGLDDYPSGRATKAEKVAALEAAGKTPADVHA